MITINIQEADGRISSVNIPKDISLSLMEVLKAGGYDIQASCGGMALCGTCHVGVTEGFDHLIPAGEQELETLDGLPNSEENSRLSCQLRLSQILPGMTFILKGDQ
ncbi:2Fe-2S iron-sulfur cluster-binding protein [Mucilaginibacter antarcticus]